MNDGRKLLIELGAMTEKGSTVQRIETQQAQSVVQNADPKSANSGKFSSNKAEQNNGLTKIGQQMAKMPIDPRLARMILGGAHFGVLNEVLIIVAALAVQDPRERPNDKQTQADQKHALFKEGDSDFLFYIKLWETLQNNRASMNENKRRNFARQHF